MSDIFEATLTGSDSAIDGSVELIILEGYGPAYAFTSIDNTLHLVIAKSANGKWIRVAGTEPYFSGWIDELSEQVANVRL